MHLIRLTLAFLSPDPAYKTLLTKAEERQRQARAEGTWSNCRTAVKNFRVFCEKFGIPTEAPTAQDICCWIEQLAHTQKAPGSVANSVSQMRLHGKVTGNDMTVFSHPRVTLALEAVARSKIHVPRPRPPIPIAILKKVIMKLQDTSTRRTVATAVLIMFYAGLRQSEVAPRSKKSYDPTRHTSRQDVTIIRGRVHFQQKWAKNMQLNAQRREIVLEPAQEKELCVVRAVQQMYKDIPTTVPEQPLLIFRADRAPLCIPYMVQIWNDALRQVGANQNVFSLHSIRKAAATTAFASGMTELEIQRFGGWSSNAHKKYITTKSARKVNQALLRAIHE